MSTALLPRIHIPLLFPSPPLHSCSPHSKSKSFFKLSFKKSQSFSFRSLRPPLETAILAVEDGASMPCIRRYENDLVRLSIYGSVDFTLAVTAAAADGGVAAEEHLKEGLDVMVIETLFPGSSNPRSTVSTSLVLPAVKVKEKGRQIGRDVINDVLSRTQSKQILAMAFRQVVMHQLLHVELDFFKPGSERNMKDLEGPREVPVSFNVRSSDKGLILSLAEVVCMFVLDTTHKHFSGESLATALINFFCWLSKTKRISSKDSSARIQVNEDEILENARILLQNFRTLKGNSQIQDKHSTYWFASSLWNKLEKIGGSEFSSWTAEFVPYYKLQINASRYCGAEFGGWEEANGNIREALLTHSQMVALADILDMFLDDRYTLPNKELPCGTLKNVRKMTNNKRKYPLWGLLMTAVASAVFSVALAVSWQLASRHLFPNKQRHPADYNTLISSAEYNTHISPEATGAQHLSLETMEETLEGTMLATSLETSEEGTKLETFCAEIVRKIKDSYGWGGIITSKPGLGTWIGELPGYFKSNHESDNSPQDEQVKEPPLDIASYQVVLSLEGKIVGFQPTSGVAVNNWAANPLARELYGGKRLSPGLFEPRLQISKPDGVIVLELLMSVNPDAYFALARPAQLPFSTS
ncbi:hypothetical protein AKJ16_DCAP23863 [Drosera capensis]